MPKLFKQDQKTVLLADLRVADALFLRLKGLLGTEKLGVEEGLWIKPCNSIHTFFMNYAIDCVFLDSTLKVHAVVNEIRPGKMVFPKWGAHSVIEMAAGRSEQLKIRKGDQLYVGT